MDGRAIREVFAQYTTPKNSVLLLRWACRIACAGKRSNSYGADRQTTNISDSLIVEKEVLEELQSERFGRWLSALPLHRAARPPRGYLAFIAAAGASIGGWRSGNR